MLKGKNITKSFGEVTVLNDVSVTVGEGEFVSIMGPSGSGKTTLMFALSGMDTENLSGDIAFDGKTLSELRDNELSDLRRREMGFVFQQPTMLKNLNILDNIILPSLRDNRKKQSAITEKASDLMRQAGIAELANRGITEVSGGQLQRAGICRALMNTPKIIFGDEPTGALNSKSADEIMALFTGINGSGTAIMLVTHDAKVAAYSQRVLFMADGKIVSELTLSPYEKTNHSSRVEKITEKMREAGI